MFELPSFLAGEAEQTRYAQAVCQRFLNRSCISASPVSDQGNFSRTFVVKSTDSALHIIQFRTELQDIAPYHEARKHAGDLVPDVQYVPDAELEAAGIWINYVMYIPGKTWREVRKGWSDEQCLNSTRSLGAAFARCVVSGGSSRDTIESYVKPALRDILSLANNDPQVAKFIPLMEHQLETADKLGILPLAATHQDLRQTNIMVKDDLSGISGLIDWEYSNPVLKPFGFAFYTFHYISWEYHPDAENFTELELSNKMNEAMWEGIMAGLDTKTRDLLVQNLDVVHAAIITGTLLDRIHVEDAELQYHAPALEALGGHLRYKLPDLSRYLA